MRYSQKEAGMLKKARDFMKMLKAWGCDTVLDVMPSHISYTRDEVLAIIVLAHYYCQPDTTVMAIIRVFMATFPSAVRCDLVLNGQDDEVVASWLSLRTMLYINENVQSENDLEGVISYLLKECIQTSQ